MDAEDINLKEDEDGEERWNEPVESAASFLETRDGLQQASHALNVGEDRRSSVSTSGAGSDRGIMSRMALNDNKAGMDGLDKEKINRIILEASKGSRFYENERKKEAQVNQRIDRMMEQLSAFTQEQKAAALVEVDTMVAELEATRDFSRSIAHLDMDAFYAAVEMRDVPSLKDKPMAVGGMSMLSTSNYQARRYGVRAAMPGFIARKLCPELVIVPVNFDKYRAVSAQVRQILAQYDPNFCPMSLDEAYFDLTDHLERRKAFSDTERTFDYGDWNWQPGTTARIPESQEGDSAGSFGEISEQDSTRESCARGGTNEKTPSSRSQMDVSLSTNFPSRCAESIDDSSSDSCHAHVSLGVDRTESFSNSAAGAATPGKRSRTFGFAVEEVVEEIRFRIEQKTQLTASAGTAPNVMLAKICSDKNKPNGQYRIQPNREAVMVFIRDLPIRKVSGIGKVTERMLSALGIQNCTDLYQQRALVHLLFSQTSSHHFLRISMGLGSTRVERDGERKSMSTERTFRELHKPADLYSKCSELCRALAEDLQNEEMVGKTVTIKLKTVKFEVKTKACSVPTAVNSADCIFNVAKDLLKAEINACKPEPLRLRLMGVRLSNLQPCTAATNKQGSIAEFFKKQQQTETRQCERLPEAAQGSSSGYEKPKPQNRIVGVSTDSPKERVGTKLESQPSTSGPKSENPFLPTHPSDQNFVSVDDRMIDDFKTEETHKRDKSATEDGSVDVLEASEFLCPVCNIPQPCTDLEAFNEHVDVCLNRGAIREMLQQQASEDIPTGKRNSMSPAKGKRSSSGSKSAAKRWKQEKTQTNTLDKFFN